MNSVMVENELGTMRIFLRVSFAKMHKIFKTHLLFFLEKPLESWRGNNTSNLLSSLSVFDNLIYLDLYNNLLLNERHDLVIIFGLLIQHKYINNFILTHRRSNPSFML